MDFMDDVEHGDLKRHVGTMRQLGRADLYELAEGQGRGSRVARLTCADGFDLEVFPDRGLDLGAVSWRGIPLAWLSASGPVAPGLLDPGTDGWERGFGGGLLTTCGLDQFGSESQDGTERLPLHGRAHRLVASGVHVWSEQVEKEWQIGVAGQTRQSTPFRENLRLDRSITTALGSAQLRIQDTVTNDGHLAWPHMLLYHFNLGWPLVDKASKLRIIHSVAGDEFDGTEAIPRDDAAVLGVADWSRLSGPVERYDEQVFRHELPPNAITTIRITSPRAGIVMEIAFASKMLPYLFQWKLLGTGTYVLGIEPANSSGIGGRASAREDSTLVLLAPGERRDYDLTITVSVIG